MRFLNKFLQLKNFYIFFSISISVTLISNKLSSSSKIDFTNQKQNNCIFKKIKKFIQYIFSYLQQFVLTKNVSYISSHKNKFEIKLCNNEVEIYNPLIYNH